MAYDQMAGGLGRLAVLALRTCAGAARSSSPAAGSAGRGVAVDRVAGRRGRADQILALDAAEADQLPQACRLRQAALAHRTRLPGAQAGVRARALRGARMARLPSSRHVVHRGLWIPDLRKGDDSPLRTWLHLVAPDAWPIQWSSTRSIRLCGPSVTCPTRSPPCASD